jgi:hypothetical protein
MTAALSGGARKFAALALGAASVFGFAPFHLSALPVLTLALLFVLWRQSATPRAGAALGFSFGLGFFLAGTSWVYISLHTFGGMPAPITAIATLGFCAVVACYPAIAGWLSLRLLWRCAPEQHTTLLVLVTMPACWTVGELLRGYLLTGFPVAGHGLQPGPRQPPGGLRRRARQLWPHLAHRDLRGCPGPGIAAPAGAIVAPLEPAGRGARARDPRRRAVAHDRVDGAIRRTAEGGTAPGQCRAGTQIQLRRAARHF